MGLKYRIRQHLKENSAQYMLILGIFIIGFVLGFLNVRGLDDEVKQYLVVMLDNYLRGGLEGDLFGKSILITAFIKQAETICSIWLLGLTVIGLPLILAVIFLRGFSLGFTVGFLFQQKAGAGVLLSMVSILPQNLVYVPSLIVAGVVAMNFSVFIVKSRNAGGNSLGVALLAYSIVMLLLLIAFVLGAFIEAYLSPWLLGLCM
ncbi:stage ii sporulation protein m (spoiim) [hydrocarbon metagenome]|uniref:Stage ii sporulation protein m (Spoiim) n=1 Tax=hydrocarbon metagenome TaxID=938273 RepID=A0A0W8E820_9ZZZZ